MAKPSFISLWNAYATDSCLCDAPGDNLYAIDMSGALNGEHSIEQGRLEW